MLVFVVNLGDVVIWGYRMEVKNDSEPGLRATGFGSGWGSTTVKRDGQRPISMTNERALELGLIRPNTKPGHEAPFEIVNDKK